MFAKTNRLMLRPAWDEDAIEIATMLHEEAQPSPAPDAPDHALLVFRRTLRAPRLIGQVSLLRTDRGAALDLWIARPFRGLGYATEAGRAAVAMALESLRVGRLVADHLADRPAAARVLRKLGFVRTEQARSGWITYALDGHAMA